MACIAVRLQSIKAQENAEKQCSIQSEYNAMLLNITNEIKKLMLFLRLQS